MKRIEAIVEGFNNIDDQGKIELWNGYCDKNMYMNDCVYDNGASFFEEFYDGKVWDAIQSVCNNSNYSVNNDYVCFDGYADPVSFNYLDDPNSPIDFETLAMWIDRTKDTDEINDLLDLELEDESEED